MNPVRMRYAGVSYYDRTRALERGEVRPDGVDLEFVTVDEPAKHFGRMAQHAEFEASEMSLSTHVLMLSRGEDRLVGIPAFPSRAFRHGQVYVNARAGIRRPADLAGRRVGIPEYQMTAALWIRAFLQHDYGVTPDMLEWRVGGLRRPGYVERLRHDPPEGVSIERIPDDMALEPMLAAGELDALVTTGAPEAFRRGNGVERLFPDHRRVEREYYQRTGLFPIMHLVVIRRDVYDANPGIAVSLLAAFEESKRRAAARLRAMGTLAVMHPWLPGELADVRECFGGDPFAYGVDANRRDLEALVRYSAEQGLAARDLDLEELFAPETWDWQPGPEPEERV